MSDNGQKIWETENLGYLECPVIVGDKLYIRNIQETLFTFELTSGKEIGKMVVEQNTHIKQEPSRSPNSNGRFLVIPVDSYTLVTYQP
jgi:hypothetical protein